MTPARPIPWLALLAVSAAADAPPRAEHAAAYLGVSTVAVTPALCEQLGLPPGVGVTVDAVEADGPAHQAGLAVHDVLTRFDDQIVVNVAQLAVLVRLKHAGESAELTLVRHGRPMVVAVRLGERVPATGPAARPRSVVQHTDAEHAITVTTQSDGDRQVRIVRHTGDVVYDGPLNTPADAAKLPPDCLAKIEAIQRNFERFQKLRATTTTPAH